MRYGFHVSISGKLGLEGAAQEAALLGLSAIQIFAKSPRNWKLRGLKPGELEGFRARRENLGGLPTVIHSSYLVNLGAGDELWDKSVFSLADDLAKGQALGVEYVVAHPGSSDLLRAREGALKARELAKLGRKGPKLLLENTAGGGELLGNRLETLAEIIEGTPLGVCFDTCHAFAAGYPIHQDPKGVLDQLEEVIGLRNVPVIHLNDSAADFDSRIDHHAGLLEGQIGEGLRTFITDGRLQNKVAIMEARRSTMEDAHNLRVLREWLEDTDSR
ncbi:MAG: endonuclease IV [Meiothermus sp.]